MILGVIFTLGAALCSASGFVALKRGLEDVDYKVFVLFSLLTGLILTTLVLWLVGPGLQDLPFRAAIPFMIIGSVGGGLMARISSVIATHEIGASKTHAIISASPLVTAVFGVFVLGEVITIQLGVGIVAVVVGASFLSYLAYQGKEEGPSAEERRPRLGLALTVYVVLLVGLQPVLQKMGLNMGATPLQGVFIRFLTGAVLYSGYLLFTRPELKIEGMNQVKPFLLGSLFWALNPVFMLYALQHIPSSVFAALFRTGPLFTLILTYAFLKGIERVNWKIGLGAALIISGAILVSTT